MDRASDDLRCGAPAYISSMYRSDVSKRYSAPPAATMTRRREHRVAVMAKPVLVIVDDDDASLRGLTVELDSRYGVHYQVVSVRRRRWRWPGWRS
jgi:hypothetical protein